MRKYSNKLYFSVKNNLLHFFQRIIQLDILNGFLYLLEGGNTTSTLSRIATENLQTSRMQIIKENMSIGIMEKGYMEAEVMERGVRIKRKNSVKF